MNAVSLAVSARLPQNTTQVSLSMKVYITQVLFFPVHNAHLEQLVSKHLSDMTKSSMKVLYLGVQIVVIGQHKIPR